MSRRPGVVDRWYRLDPESGERVETARHGQGLRWRARYVDPRGKDVSKRFARKVDAEAWLDGQVAGLVRGDYTSPANARLTLSQWCERWLVGYGTRRESTVKQARVHLRLVEQHLGHLLLVEVTPSVVRGFMAALTEQGLSQGYIYAVHRRLSQVMADAVHDGVLSRNPCSRRTSPGEPEARPYVATTAQVWALHDAVPEEIRPAILLGAFAGLRTSEACGLRARDLDTMRGVVRPEVQFGGAPLKSKMSGTPVPIPRELATRLATKHETVVADEWGRPVAPWTVMRAVRDARGEVEGLPEGFRFHDLRHYFASMLIASGLDVKTVQTRLRHASAMTTLNTYGHLMDDGDESTRSAVSAALSGRLA